jgi:hypothetical protein
MSERNKNIQLKHLIKERTAGPRIYSLKSKQYKLCKKKVILKLHCSDLPTSYHKKNPNLPTLFKLLFPSLSMLECRVFILSAGGRCFTRLVGAAPPAPDFLGGGSAGLLGGGSEGFLLAADFGLDALPIAEV